MYCADLGAQRATNIVPTPVSALTITAAGTGFTGNPTLLFYGG
jgi:hypothetical protein